MDKIKQAMLLAEFIHAFQVRQDGELYINHIIRVSEAVKEITDNEDLIIASILHDTVEDQNMFDGGDLEQLIATVFGDEVCDLVCVLSHNKWDHDQVGKLESYNEYIAKVFQHPTAWIIKFEDLKDNTSYEIPEKQKTKYRDACIYLMTHGVTVPDILMERLEL